MGRSLISVWLGNVLRRMYQYLKTSALKLLGVLHIASGYNWQRLLYSFQNLFSLNIMNMLTFLHCNPAQQPNIYIRTKLACWCVHLCCLSCSGAQGQSCISKRSGQTNEIIAELVNYHHFHSLTTCNIYGIMVLDRFIVVFVWEAFGLGSYLLKHIAQPLEYIMEMKSLLHAFFFSSTPMWSVFFFFFSVFFLTPTAGQKKE